MGSAVGPTAGGRTPAAAGWSQLFVSGCFSPTTFVILTNRKWQLYRLSLYGSGSRSSSDHASSSLAGVHRAFAGLVLGSRRIRTGLPHIFRSGPISADLQSVAARSAAANLQSAAVAMASAARLRPVAAELQSSADKDRYLSKPLAAALPFRAIVLIDGKRRSSSAMSLNSPARMSESMLPGRLAAW